MRKFKFFALAFAALSFAACSDDVIEGQGGGNNTTGSDTPAYLTISFSTNSGNSSRSTADDANNNGDDHSTDANPSENDPGNGEDSGHYNDGTTDERAVDNVLVVIVECSKEGVPSGNTNYAKLYSTQTAVDKDDEGYFKIIDAPNGEYVNNEAIELATGYYNVLVVANPVVDLLTDIRTAGDLNVGIRDNNAVENLYQKIIDGNYSPEKRLYQKIAAGQPLEGDDFRVMMANKGLDGSSTPKAYTVELTKDNSTIEKAATATIEVERVLSKITYREIYKNNVYEVHPKVGVVRAELVQGAVTVDDTSYKVVDLNLAKDLYENNVYVLIEENADTKVRTYTVYAKDGDDKNVYHDNESGNDYQKYKKINPQKVTDEDILDKTPLNADCYAVYDITQPESSLTYVADKNTTIPEVTWYVRLEGYALVNLSKNVHYVRHIISQTGGENAFGKLNGSNYLYTPFWEDKNKIVFDENLDYPTGTPVDDWFYNTLADVTEESQNLIITENAGAVSFTRADKEPVEYYKPMSSLGIITEDDQEVDGPIDHNPNGSPAIGNFMAYCFENSTDRDHQTHGLSTGISFVARMYSDKELEHPIERLYRYGGNLFESLAAIQETYGEAFVSEKLKEFIEKEKKDKKSITKTDLAELAADEKGGENIELYNDNICYYYTTEIKHFDNGNNSETGIMEFAIMRNNIYSLAVTDINMIGDPHVDPTPGIPDENPDQEPALLNVEVQILPWIVRYNDIEF